MTEYLHPDYRNAPTAINPTQVRQKIMQVGIVQLCKWTHFGLINVDGKLGTPLLLILVFMSLGI